MIACDCPVCCSPNPRNRRHRTSAYLELPGGAVLIDTPPELRLQALAFDIRRVDAVLITHAHADHIAGFDDLRRFNELVGRSIPVYGLDETMAEIRLRWGYIFDPNTQLGGGKPEVTLVPVRGPFELLGETIVPVPARHGRLPVLGYRVGGFAYLTDCSDLPPESRELLRGLEVLVLGAIRRRPHETHFNLEQALAVVAELRPDQTYFTHLTHELEYEATNRELPPSVALAYDGLVIECGA
ncbi:MAG: MBL fold metallo-hydrolase [Firmicutes bacterium]|nr:MBL fold metallo-hydrolase [Bacillota bacterium]